MPGVIKDIVARERCWMRGHRHNRRLFAAMGVDVQRHQAKAFNAHRSPWKITPEVVGLSNMPRPLRYIRIRSRTAASRTPFPSYVPSLMSGTVARTRPVWTHTAEHVSLVWRLMALVSPARSNARNSGRVAILGRSAPESQHRRWPNAWSKASSTERSQLPMSRFSNAWLVAGPSLGCRCNMPG